jgi:hypothetical protein
MARIGRVLSVIERNGGRLANIIAGECRYWIMMPESATHSPDAATEISVNRVWYAAYGSNMSAARLRCYLEGGQPPGAARVYPGCRDRTPPARDEPVMLPGGIYFALHSRVWGGGLALYDPNLPGETPARAYLLTAGQVADIAAQEMRREPGTDLDLAGAIAGGRHQFGPGRYETLVTSGERDGHPLLTLTAPWSAGAVEWTAPTAAYLRMLGSGLQEAHGWSREEIASYLCGLPGARGSWPEVAVAELLDGRGA